MISYTNYMTVKKSCYAVQSSDSRTTETTLKDKIISMIYPAMGTLGIAYQIYLLLSLN